MPADQISSSFRKQRMSEEFEKGIFESPIENGFEWDHQTCWGNDHSLVLIEQNPSNSNTYNFSDFQSLIYIEFHASNSRVFPRADWLGRSISGHSRKEFDILNSIKALIMEGRRKSEGKKNGDHVAFLFLSYWFSSIWKEETSFDFAGSYFHPPKVPPMNQWIKMEEIHTKSIESEEVKWSWTRRGRLEEMEILKKRQKQRESGNGKG